MKIDINDLMRSMRAELGRLMVDLVVMTVRAEQAEAQVATLTQMVKDNADAAKGKE